MTSGEALLLACLHQDPNQLDPHALARVDADGWRSLFLLAASQRVRPRVHQRLAAFGAADLVPPPLWQELTTARDRIARKNLLLHSELAQLLSAFSAVDIPVIALKGAHLAHAIYGDIGIREIGDLDLLVHRQDLARSTSLVLGRGYTTASESSVDLEANVSPHGPRLRKSPIAVEMHWNIIEPGESYSIDPSSLWPRAVPFSIPGARALALCDEDLLLHLCAHAAYHHRFEFGLRSLCDIAELIERRGPDISWAEVDQRATDWHWARGVYLTLALARELLGARIPDGFIQPHVASTVSEEVCQVARTQLMARHGAHTKVDRRLGLLGRSAGIREACRAVGARVFLSANDLRREYPRAPQTPWRLWMWYLVRAIDLVRHHLPTLLRLHIWREDDMVTIVERQRRLHDWLAGAHGSVDDANQAFPAALLEKR